jgi:predicted ATPase
VATLSHSVETGPPLLERQDVLAALGDAFAEVEAGHGRFVLLAGEAGGGKTVVVRRFCEEAESAARLLWGACDPLFTPRPLGPLLDIADGSGAELRAAVEDGRGPHEIVLLLLREASSRPTIIVVEDVHWADEATYDVLRLLARKVERSRALVIATFREDEIDRTHALQIVVGELATSPAVRRISVEPLSEAAVAELAAPARVDPVVLFRETSGNPFFVTEVLAARDEAIPATIRDAVLARAARLSPPGREVLDAVAIAASRVEPWLLEALAGNLADGLDECLACGMLVARAGGIEFRHELARLAWEESLDPVQRVALHRKALSALRSEAGEADAARLAHHADAAGDAEAVLRYATQAAERAAVLHAHREPPPNMPARCATPIASRRTSGRSFWSARRNPPTSPIAPTTRSPRSRRLSSATAGSATEKRKAPRSACSRGSRCVRSALPRRSRPRNRRSRSWKSFPPALRSRAPTRISPRSA